MIHTAIKLAALIAIIAVILYIASNRNNPGVRSWTTPTTEIVVLLKQPTQYDGRIVSVQGKVAGSAGIFGHGAYLLQQEGSEDAVLVITQHGIPPAGTATRVIGTFKQAVSFGLYQYAVIFQQP